jgi:hypothetical protein
VKVLSEKLERAWRADGRFRMHAAPRRAGLAELAARYRELAAEPLVAASAPGPAGEAFAQAFLSARFRLQLDLVDRAHAESRDLEAGLALLRALHESYYALADTEAREVARRVDLSAAILRAVRLDLEALRETGAHDLPGAPDPADVARLIALAREEDPDARAEGLAALDERVERVCARMEASLFTPRLWQRLSMELARREGGREQAAAARRELHLLLPEWVEEGTEPPQQIAKMKKHERYRAAVGVALGGLSGDVLDDELAYAIGLATDFVDGRPQSRTWFDRYLALHGIRSYDGRTYARDLTDEERYALQMVQSLPPIGR